MAASAEQFRKADAWLNKAQDEAELKIDRYTYMRGLMVRLPMNNVHQYQRAGNPILISWQADKGPSRLLTLCR